MVQDVATKLSFCPNNLTAAVLTLEARCVSFRLSSLEIRHIHVLLIKWSKEGKIRNGISLEESISVYCMPQVCEFCAPHQLIPIPQKKNAVANQISRKKSQILLRITSSFLFKDHQYNISAAAMMTIFEKFDCNLYSHIVAGYVSLRRSRSSYKKMILGGIKHKIATFLLMLTFRLGSF